MTYLSDRKRKKKRITNTLIALVVFIIFGIYWNYIAQAVRYIATPFLRGYVTTKETVSGAPSLLRTYAGWSQSQDTITSLEATIERLENELASKNAQLEEVHTALAIRKEDAIDQPLLVLYPLANDVTSLYSTILLSKGFKDGIEIGDSVFIRGLQPVCTIKEVYTTTSLCELLSASGRTLTGVLRHGSSTVSITLTGRGGGTFLGDIPRDIEVSEGDSVYLEGSPSMLLGTVTQSIHNDQDTSWRIFVRGMYNPLTSHIFYIKK
jgi:cell shape-determining protein MreC